MKLVLEVKVMMHVDGDVVRFFLCGWGMLDVDFLALGRQLSFWDSLLGRGDKALNFRLRKNASKSPKNHPFKKTPVCLLSFFFCEASLKQSA